MPRVVGNDFIVPRRPTRPRLQTAPAQAAPAIQPLVPVLEDLPIELEELPARGQQLWQKAWELMHHYSLGAFALLFLVVSASAIEVGKSYWLAEHLAAAASPSIKVPTQPVSGPNTVVPSAKVNETLQQITAQPVNLDIAGKNAAISAETIRSWLQVVPDKKHGVTYIHVDYNLVAKSVSEAANSKVITPVNQVSVTYADGSSRIIAAGRNGTKIGDTSAAVQQITKGLISAKGFQLTIPTETQNFAALTAASFEKMIDIDINKKQMYLFEKGQMIRQYPISAGAPATPTPVGQFKIFSKLPVQDMRGYNADGTKYFQPKVKWVNYFLTGGYAIHGNYWRPQSWFGAINSSHGCASLPDAQAKEVYDWAPIGTTVITHS